MKLCTDCKHLQAGYCRRLRGEPSPVDGTRISHSNPAGHERSGGRVIAWLNEACGKAGRFFEAKR